MRATALYSELVRVRYRGHEQVLPTALSELEHLGQVIVTRNAYFERNRQRVAPAMPLIASVADAECTQLEARARFVACPRDSLVSLVSTRVRIANCELRVVL